MSQATSKLNELRKTESIKTGQLDDLNAEDSLKTLERSLEEFKSKKEMIIDEIEVCESNEDDSRKKKELTSMLDDKMNDLEVAKNAQKESQTKVDNFLADLPGYVAGNELTQDELLDHKRNYISKERKANEKQESVNKKYMTKQTRFYILFL